MVAKRALLWRSDSPLFDFPATFSSLNKNSIGGTDLQLILHADQLVSLGFDVFVLGATSTNITEKGVVFVGSQNGRQQIEILDSGTIPVPDLILLEGAFSAAPRFRAYFPRAIIVHVGQNIDAGVGRNALKMAGTIDFFAAVSSGHLASLLTVYPALSNRFILIRNIVPWEQYYANLVDRTPRHNVMWIGGWGKRGFITWLKILSRISKEDSTLTFTLCGPTYGGSNSEEIGEKMIRSFCLPPERTVIRSYPYRYLPEAILDAKVVLCSLGNETGAISTQDAHAAFRPVVSGNDLVYWYLNPDTCGVRVSSFEEGYAALGNLLSSPERSEHLGRNGRRMVAESATEAHQRTDFTELLARIDLGRPSGGGFRPDADRALARAERFTRIKNRILGRTR